jgi:hypothetical protein
MSQDNPTTERQQLEQSIAALEAQRLTLGDAVVDAAVASMRKQLASLLAAAQPEQRKLLTVLFADLVGFTSMSERLDPEEVREIQQAYFNAVTLPSRSRAAWSKSTSAMRSWPSSVYPRPVKTTPNGRCEPPWRCRLLYSSSTCGSNRSWACSSACAWGSIPAW